MGVVKVLNLKKTHEWRRLDEFHVGDTILREGMDVSVIDVYTAEDVTTLIYETERHEEKVIQRQRGEEYLARKRSNIVEEQENVENGDGFFKRSRKTVLSTFAKSDIDVDTNTSTETIKVDTLAEEQVMVVDENSLFCRSCGKPLSEGRFLYCVDCTRGKANKKQYNAEWHAQHPDYDKSIATAYKPKDFVVNGYCNNCGKKLAADRIYFCYSCTSGSENKPRYNIEWHAKKRKKAGHGISQKEEVQIIVAEKQEERKPDNEISLIAQIFDTEEKKDDFDMPIVNIDSFGDLFEVQDVVEEVEENMLERCSALIQTAIDAGATFFELKMPLKEGIIYVRFDVGAK